MQVRMKLCLYQFPKRLINGVEQAIRSEVHSDKDAAFGFSEWIRIKNNIIVKMKEITMD